MAFKHKIEFQKPFNPKLLDKLLSIITDRQKRVQTITKGAEISASAKSFLTEKYKSSGKTIAYNRILFLERTTDFITHIYKNVLQRQKDGTFF